jgi:hypothetical protein
MPREIFHTGALFTLIQIEASFLPTPGIYPIANSPLPNLYGLWNVSKDEGCSATVRQSFTPARADIVASQYTIRTYRPDQRIRDITALELYARCMKLGHQPAIIAIDDEPRQKVGLRMDQAVGIYLWREESSKLQSLFDAPKIKGFIYELVPVFGKEAKSQAVLGVEMTSRDPGARASEDIYYGAGRDILWQGSECSREDPGVPSL